MLFCKALVIKEIKRQMIFILSATHSTKIHLLGLMGEFKHILSE